MRPSAWKEQPTFSHNQKTSIFSAREHARLSMVRIQAALRILDNPNPQHAQPGEPDDLSVVHEALLRARECLTVAVADAEVARFTP